MALHVVSSGINVTLFTAVWRGRHEDTSRTESSDFLSVLDELHTHALPNGGVWLLRFDTDLLEDNAFGV